MLSTAPNSCYRVFPVLAAAASLLLLSACANRDAVTMQATMASTTLQMAEQAGAPQRVPDHYAEASDTVGAAEQAVAEQEWDEALENGQLGEAQAALSLYKAQAMHTRQRLEAVTLLPVN